MRTFPAIEDHGLIGDLQTAALVTDDGTIDWFCAPRFDSPSIFASLLDQRRAATSGSRRRAPTTSTKQLYLPGTPILITRFLSADGVGEVVDFMPITGSEATDRHRLVRMVRVVRGADAFPARVPAPVQLRPRRHEVEISERRGAFRSRTMTMNVSAARHERAGRDRGHRADDKGVQLDGDPVRGRHRRHGARDGAGRAARGGHAGGHALFEQTRDFWRGWIGRSTYKGRWREMVERSAMTLKLMTYAPTGALVAAPTAGLPEQVGGERNWDYRFTWVRDASFSVYALLGSGLHRRGAGVPALAQRPHPRGAARRARHCRSCTASTARPTCRGDLDHFEGYKGSSPVRIGNGAATSCSSTSTARRWTRSHSPTRTGCRWATTAWRHLASMIDWLCEHWDQPDDGIWETRGGRQDFVYGRLMAWVAFDRAIRMASAAAARPTSTAGRTCATWSTGRSWSAASTPRRRRSSSTTTPTCWTRRCSTCRWSASSRRATRCGSRRCARWTRNSSPTASSTATTPAPHPTGCAAPRARSRCAPSGTSTRWPAPGGLDDARLDLREDAHLQQPRRAVLRGDRTHRRADRQLPQAFSHLALISAAMNLDYQLDHGAGSVEADGCQPWSDQQAEGG